MLPMAFARSTFCLDEPVRYRSIRAIRLVGLARFEGGRQVCSYPSQWVGIIGGYPPQPRMLWAS